MVARWLQGGCKAVATYLAVCSQCVCNLSLPSVARWSQLIPALGRKVVARWSTNGLQRGSRRSQLILACGRKEVETYSGLWSQGGRKVVAKWFATWPRRGRNLSSPVFAGCSPLIPAFGYHFENNMFYKSSRGKTFPLKFFVLFKRWPWNKFFVSWVY